MIQNITEEFLSKVKKPDPAGRKLNCLLVVPRLTGSDTVAYLFPTGLAYISSAIKASGRNLQVLNLNYKNDYKNLLLEKIVHDDIDIVLTGGLSGQYSKLREIVDVAKSAKPNVVVIVGGGIITAEPRVAFEALEHIDYGVIGEGEFVVNELLFALENSKDASVISGLIGKDFCNSSVDIENLDMLPFPDFEGLSFCELQTKQNVSLNMDMRLPSLVLSRSCPYNCTFCFHSSGKKYRRRSINNIFQEIDWIISTFEIEGLFISDELFCDRSNFVYEFCERIKPYNIEYFAQTRVDMVDKQKLKALKESGCSILSLGIESADNTILKSMRKNITVEQIENAYDIAIEVGLQAFGNIILGDVNETKKTYTNSLSWLSDHPEYQVSIYGLYTFPGSEIYKIACDKGIIKDRVKYLREEKFLINTTSMSDDDYREMFETADMFSVIYKNAPDFDLSVFKRNMDSILRKHKVAVWPAVKANISFFLMVYPELLDNENFWLVNSRPGGTFYASDNYLVQTPNVIDENNIDVVLYLYLAEGFASIYDDIKEHHPSVKCILKIDDLNRKNFIIRDC